MRMAMLLQSRRFVSRGLCHELPHVAAVRFDALVYGTGPSGLVGMTCKRRARIRQ